MAVFSVKWAPQVVDAVGDALVTLGAATSGDVARSARRAHDDVASILASLREAGYVTVEDVDGPFGEDGGKWSLTDAGRAHVVQELQEGRARILELEQCVANGLAQWDLTLDYLDPLGEMLPDIEGWSHYDWRTMASAVLAGPGVDPAPLRKRERDPKVNGPAPVYIDDGATAGTPLVLWTTFKLDDIEFKVSHGGKSPIWINGVSIFQPGDPAGVEDEVPADAPPDPDDNHWGWQTPDDGEPWPDIRLFHVGDGFPTEWPDENAPWLWPGERPWVHHGDDDDRAVHRHVRLFGREVFAYSSTRSAPGWFRDLILSRWVRR